MAKKRKPPTPDENGILDTGIYTRDTRILLLRGQEIPAYFRSQYARQSPTTREFLDQQLRVFRAVRDQDAGEASADALQAIDIIHRLLVERDDDGNLTVTDPIDWKFQQAYLLGRLAERITAVRPFEPLVLAERGRRKGAVKAMATVNADHAELRPLYQAKVDQLMAGGSSYSAACRQVADSLGVSDRTVREHTTNPAPRNRGKWQG